jgi:hypothetical protein
MSSSALSMSADLETRAPAAASSATRHSRPLDSTDALADVAASGGGVCKSAFVTSALRRLSVALCRGNGRMNGEPLFTLARASGRAFQPGLLVPVAE